MLCHDHVTRNRPVKAFVCVLVNQRTPHNRVVVHSPRECLYSASVWFTLCAFVNTRLCSNAPFYWMISECVNSSHLEISTFVLVCDTWGSAGVTESKPSVKMGHFRVISQCQIDHYVKYLQNLKHLWCEYNASNTYKV